MATSAGMTRWTNRVAVVTGASVGIGAAISKSLVQNGMIVIGLARNKEAIEVRNSLRVLRKMQILCYF